jgi:hypothetical protein
MLRPLIKLALLLSLATAILNASTQAKLGLYQPPDSAAHITAKRTKLFEVRIERVAAVAPIEPVIVITPLFSFEPRVQVPEPRPPCPQTIPRAHSIRPPPSPLASC